MYFNDFELDVQNQNRIEFLRDLAQPMSQPTSIRFVRISVAHALVGLANLIWRDEAEPATTKVAVA